MKQEESESDSDEQPVARRRGRKSFVEESEEDEVMPVSKKRTYKQTT